MTTILDSYPAVGDTLTCGHARPAGPIPGPTGYARTHDGRTLCYPCADDSERAALATADTLVGYVSSAGDLTTWTGGVLARGIRHAHGVSRSGWHGSEIHSWRFSTPDGSLWYGRNAGPGFVITIRRAKRATS